MLALGSGPGLLHVEIYTVLLHAIVLIVRWTHDYSLIHFKSLGKEGIYPKSATDMYKSDIHMLKFGLSTDSSVGFLDFLCTALPYVHVIS